jgi:malate dehydrogenase (quinone)
MQGDYHHEKEPDVALVGAGIMSATLGVLLKELNPRLSISIFETLDQVAAESSNAWNNAGTGHAALCELNYTPQLADGSIETAKAMHINESFELSKQLWAYLVESGVIEDPGAFIHQTPHLSFVHGEENVRYLRKRHAALCAHHLFDTMQYSEKRRQLAEWMPLVMDGRGRSEPVAATRAAIGADVDFGALTRLLIAHLSRQPDVSLHLRWRIEDVRRQPDARWRLTVKDHASSERHSVVAKFVFLGAGGGALPLLQKSGIPESRGFGGFPVSGQWLRCDNPAVVERHHAKVYGKAPLGSPPMSVPHLDTRIIDGQTSLLFGPYAGFSTKYLKTGSLLDFPLSFRPGNLLPMLAAGVQNIDLTRYLIGQVLQSPEERLKALQVFVPTAKLEDWDLENAGQRVQIIKKDARKGGVLQFGTEVVAAADGTLAALLGASPGASTAVSIMLDLIGRCFPAEMTGNSAWKRKLRKIIPSFGKSLIDDPALYRKTHARTTEALKLHEDTNLARALPV